MVKMYTTDGNGKMVDVSNVEKYRRLAESMFPSFGFPQCHCQMDDEDDGDEDLETTLSALKRVSPMSVVRLSPMEIGMWYEANLPIIEHAKGVYNIINKYTPLTGIQLQSLFGTVISPIGSDSMFTVTGVDVENNNVYLSNGKEVSSTELLLGYTSKDGPIGVLKKAKETKAFKDPTNTNNPKSGSKSKPADN